MGKRAATTKASHWLAGLKASGKVGFLTFTLALAIAPDIIQILLDGYGDMLPPGFRVWLLGAAAVITATAGVVAKIRSAAKAAAELQAATAPTE